MLKQIGIRLEESLIAQAKIFAIQHNLKLQDLVSASLAAYMGQEPPPPREEKSNKSQNSLPSTKKDDRIEEKKEEKLDISKLDPDEYFVIRKTHKKKEDPGTTYRIPMTNVEWTIMGGDLAHYDKDGHVIPFTYTNWTGVEVYADEEDAAWIEKETGKKVVFE